MTPEVMKLLAVGIAAGLGMLGPALAIGLIGYSALQGISRNPEARGPIMTNMILVTALLVLPGLSALQLDEGFKKTVIMSVVFGVGSVILGIFASAILDVATSGVIVFTLVLVFITISSGTRLSRANKQDNIS